MKTFYMLQTYLDPRCPDCGEHGTADVCGCGCIRQRVTVEVSEDVDLSVAGETKGMALYWARREALRRAARRR